MMVDNPKVQRGVLWRCVFMVLSRLHVSQDSLQRALTISSLSETLVSSKTLPLVPAIQGRLLGFTVLEKERGIADPGTLGAASRLTASKPSCVWLFPALFGLLVLRQMLMQPRLASNSLRAKEGLDLLFSLPPTSEC